MDSPLHLCVDHWKEQCCSGVVSTSLRGLVFDCGVSRASPLVLQCCQVAAPHSNADFLQLQSQSVAAGIANYTVAQGDTLTVNFNTNSSSTVIMGGAPNGGFSRDPPCQVAGNLGPAPQQPIALNTITGFTFAPTRAVCPSVSTGRPHRNVD